MDKILLVISIIFYFYVMKKKRIPPISLYALFGLQWFFYLFFPFLLSMGVYLFGYVSAYPLNYVPDIQYYFILFNAGALITFALVYFLLYRKVKPKVENHDYILLKHHKKYRRVLFVLLIILNVIIILLSLVISYKNMTWLSHSVNANLRNVILALFIFYMLLKPAKIRLNFIFGLFCLSTIIYGGRIYTLVLATCYFFYLYDTKVLKLRHMILLLLASILFLTSVGLIRTGEFKSINRIYDLGLRPMYSESVFSSYPGFAVINMWKNGQIKYYTYFGSYLIDPILGFVPQFIFVQSGISKGHYNILGAWEEDHGKRSTISPQGGYYYIAEAIEALSAPGVFIVVFVFALACILVESFKYKTILGKYTYYSFVGTVGLGFVSDQFAWTMKSFGMNYEVLFVFIIVFQLINTSIVGSKKIPVIDERIYNLESKQENNK